MKIAAACPPDGAWAALVVSASTPRTAGRIYCRLGACTSAQLTLPRTSSSAWRRSRGAHRPRALVRSARHHSSLFTGPCCRLLVAAGAPLARADLLRACTRLGPYFAAWHSAAAGALHAADPRRGGLRSPSSTSPWHASCARGRRARERVHFAGRSSPPRANDGGLASAPTRVSCSKFPRGCLLPPTGVRTTKFFHVGRPRPRARSWTGAARGRRPRRPPIFGVTTFRSHVDSSLFTGLEDSRDVRALRGLAMLVASSASPRHRHAVALRARIGFRMAVARGRASCWAALHRASRPRRGVVRGASGAGVVNHGEHVRRSARSNP